MKLHRDPTEPEYLVALVAAQALPALIEIGPPERPLTEVVDTAVTYGEDLVRQVVDRADMREADEPGPTPLPPGILFIDEFGSQNREGGDERKGISIDWSVATDLAHDQVSALMGAVIDAVEKFVDSKPALSSISVQYDRD